MDAKTLCLGALICGDASGYEIRKLYEEGPFSAFHQVGYGSIYPALNRLQAEGLATVTELEQDGRPDKKVYTITEAGRRAFTDALRSAPTVDKFRSDTLFILSFGELLPADVRTAVLDAYAAEHQARLEAIDACGLDDEAATPGRLFVRNFGRAIYATIIRYIAENRHLLEQPDGERTIQTTAGER